MSTHQEDQEGQEVQAVQEVLVHPIVPAVREPIHLSDPVPK